MKEALLKDKQECACGCCLLHVTSSSIHGSCNTLSETGGPCWLCGVKEQLWLADVSMERDRFYRAAVVPDRHRGVEA